MVTNDEIDNKLEELDIIKAIENKDVPYVITQIKGLIDETDKEARADERSRVLAECEYRLHHEFMQDFMRAIANMDEAIFRQIHELKNNKNENEED
jgi:hypothetical protein